MSKYFLFDCETGGTADRSTSLLTMYGMILDQNLAVLDDISLKVKPNDGVYKVTPKAMAINKIDLSEHHPSAVPEHEASVLFVDFIARNNIGSTRIIPVGHNVPFDVAFMKRLIGGKTWSRTFSRKVIDTASIAEFLCLSGVFPPSHMTDCSLKGLAERFDFSYDGAHDAEFDAKLTLKVLKRLLAVAKKELKP